MNNNVFSKHFELKVFTNYLKEQRQKKVNNLNNLNNKSKIILKSKLFKTLFINKHQFKKNNIH